MKGQRACVLGEDVLPEADEGDFLLALLAVELRQQIADLERLRQAAVLRSK